MSRHSPEPPVALTCQLCGKAFTVYASVMRFYREKGKTRGSFCSNKCRTDASAVTLTQQLILDNCIPEPNSGCWLWDGPAHHRFGYGKIGHSRRKYDPSHRASYMVFKGPVPAGLLVRHACDNPHCVNPDHLVLGTPADNMDDMVQRGRSLYGSRNPQAVLTEEIVLTIKSMLAAGVQQKTIAAQYGVWQSAISKIAIGESWRHVPIPTLAWRLLRAGALGGS